MMPSPSGVVRSRSATSNSGSPKKTSAPSCSSDDDRAQEHADRRARHPAVVGQDRLALVGRRGTSASRSRSLRSSSGRSLSSQYLKTSGEDRGLRLVEVEDLAEQQRPERVDRRPDLGAELARQRQELDRVAGRPRTSSRATCTRSTTFGLVASPGAARPVRSPLMSATKTGTPAFDSWPARSCRVLVLPVPGGAGDQAVAVEHRQRDLDARVVDELAVEHRAADDEARLGRARSRPPSRRGTPCPWVLRGAPGSGRGLVGKRIIGPPRAAIARRDDGRNDA